jgi:hypothetical protein
MSKPDLKAAAGFFKSVSEECVVKLIENDWNVGILSLLMTEVEWLRERIEKLEAGLEAKP